MIVTFKSHLRQIFILTRTVENKNTVVGKPQKMILFIISTYSEGFKVKETLLSTDINPIW